MVADTEVESGSTVADEIVDWPAVEAAFPTNTFVWHQRLAKSTESLAMGTADNHATARWP